MVRTHTASRVPRASSLSFLSILTLSLVFLPVLGCTVEEPQDPAVDPCTSAPPLPTGSPVAVADWQAAVHDNCFEDLNRLGRWAGGTAPLAPKQSPQSGYSSVGQGSIESGPVVVLVHGWAPGFRTAVDRAGGDLLWWQDGATDSTGVWTSDWAWVPSRGTDTPIEITSTGVFQEIVTNDSGATVLGYSWIDNSATIDDSYFDLLYVYRSEAYTNLNGLRLAQALDQALAPSFWSNPANSLHLVGHSHGSKVVTVATLALQSQGKRVDHLTILDSPESMSTLKVNGANLLGFYLNQIQTKERDGSGTGAFVDNYVSYFGTGFNGSDNANRAVDVILDPQLYGCLGAGDRHSYSAQWYGGAAVGGAAQGLSLGLNWPPPPPSASEGTLNQTWPGGITEKAQWPLTAGFPGSIGCDSTARLEATCTRPATATFLSKSGNVSGDLASSLLFSAGPAAAEATYRAGTNFGSKQFGIAFDVQWTSPRAGDYLVLAGTDIDGGWEVLFVMDGKSAIPGRNPVSINTYVDSSLEIFISYQPAAGNSEGQVTLSGLKAVDLGC